MTEPSRINALQSVSANGVLPPLNRDVRQDEKVDVYIRHQRIEGGQMHPEVEELARRVESAAQLLST